MIVERSIENGDISCWTLIWTLYKPTCVFEGEKDRTHTGCVFNDVEIAAHD